MPVPFNAEHRRTTALLWAVLLAGAVLRLAYAAAAQGIFHPDEIHQSLEPAHRVVYGFGIRPWEFVRGARPWTTPGVYVVLLGLLKASGLTTPAAYLLVVRVFDALVASTWPWFCFRIGRALRSPRAGVLAATLAATWYFLVLLAPRALNHTLSVTFALWALARVVEGKDAGATRAGGGGRLRLALTGVLFGLAFAFRYQDGLVLAGAVAFLALERRWRELPSVIVGALVPVMAVGLLDQATWGVPFHSLFDYLRANVVQHASARDGVMDASFYLTRLPVALGLGALWLALLPFLNRRAWRLLLTVGATMLLLHSLTDNKQLRFVLPAILVLFCALACGADALLERLSARNVKAAAVTGALLAASWIAGSVISTTQVTFADLGIFVGQAEAVEQPWQFRADLNRALMRVGRREDLCGLVVYPYGGHAGAARLVTTGGYTFLHRAVPITMGPLTDEARSFTNYALVCPDAQGRIAALEGFQPLGRVGRCIVLRANDGQCDRAAAEGAMRDFRW